MINEAHDPRCHCAKRNLERRDLERPINPIDFSPRADTEPPRGAALTCRSQWHVSPMKGKPMDPLGIGSLQFLSRVAVHRSCHSCWETARSRTMDTRQAARVARAETRSKVSNSMVMESPAASAELCQLCIRDRKSAGMIFFSFFLFLLQSSEMRLYALQSRGGRVSRMNEARCGCVIRGESVVSVRVGPGRAGEMLQVRLPVSSVSRLRAQSASEPTRI